MSCFLVTGASGFIGSAIVRRLIADGHRVVALHCKRAVPLDHPNLQWLASNLLGGGAPDLSGQGLTHCIHAAWYTNHADYLTHERNREWVAASVNLFDAFVAGGGRRFLGLGTCLEYDVAQVEGPCAEERTPLRPGTLYARCKLDLLEALTKRGGEIAWARVFFVYGPGDRRSRLVPGMIERLSRGEESGPTCGGLRRDYIHVDDLAGQLVRIATSGVEGAINTGTGQAPTLSEIFRAAARAFGRPDLARANEETGGQPPLIQADLTRFRREIGEPATRDVESGLRDLVR